MIAPWIALVALELALALVLPWLWWFYAATIVVGAAATLRLWWWMHTWTWRA